MDPEDRKMLENSLRLAEENNEMLHSIKRYMRTARIMSIVYWVFIIGTALGAFYLLQPYLEQLMNVYEGASGVLKIF